MIDFLAPKLLKQMAREQLLGKYPVTVLSYFIMQMIPFCILYFASGQTSATGAAIFVYYAIYFIVLLLNAILIVGQNYLYLRIVRKNTCALGDMWYGFKNFPDKAITIQFVCLLLYGCCGIPFYILLYLQRTTGSSAYIIPCILAFVCFLAVYVWLSLIFSQALYSLIDYPDESSMALLRRSIQLMRGHKKRLLYIWVSFAGMYLLVILTMGFAIFWVQSYTQMVRANFYNNLNRLSQINESSKKKPA